MINVDFKKERLQVLNRQIEIERKHCHGCAFMNPRLHAPRRCEGCTFYKELRAIGQRLDDLLGEDRRQRELKRMAVSFSMNVQEYKDLVASGKTDKEIIVLKKTTVGYFTKWKRSKGLVNERKNKAIEPPKKVERVKKVDSNDLLRENTTLSPIAPTVEILEKRIEELTVELRGRESVHRLALDAKDRELDKAIARIEGLILANTQLKKEVDLERKIVADLREVLAELREVAQGKQNVVAEINLLKSENDTLRAEALSLRNRVQELSQLAATETSDCDENVMAELYEKINVLNTQIRQQAEQLTVGSSVDYVAMLEEEEQFQTMLLRKLLSEREQRIALQAENKTLMDRVGLL